MRRKKQPIQPIQPEYRRFLLRILLGQIDLATVTDEDMRAAEVFGGMFGVRAWWLDPVIQEPTVVQKTEKRLKPVRQPVLQ